MKHIIALSLLVVYVLTSTAQQYDLKLNLKKGQHYKQSMTVVMDLTQSMGEQEMSINTKMQFEVAQTVKAITAKGDFEIENEYSRVAMDMDAMGQKITYDSNVKDTTDNELLKKYSSSFGKILGKKFIVVLSPKGKVIEIKGFKELLDDLGKGNPDAATKKMLEGIFDEHKITSNFESSYHMFPDNSVKIGDTWSQTKSVESMFPIEISTTYVLKEVNNGVAKITVKGDFTIKKDDYKANGITMKINFAGNYNGFYDLDINSGMSNRAEIAMPMKGTMEVMEMEVPVTVNSTITTTNTLQN
jgi:hypothetical protein